MNKAITLLIIGLLVLTGGYIFLTTGVSKQETQTTQSPAATTNLSPQEVNYSASFAIFTNGTFRIFTNPMYHNLSKDVYIEASNPNIVYIKKSEITWNDFFRTLPLKLTKECLTTGTKQTFCTDTQGTFKFYLNGKEDTDALDKKIKQGDELLVTYGSENDEQVQEQLQQVPNIK